MLSLITVQDAIINSRCLGYVIDTSEQNMLRLLLSIWFNCFYQVLSLWYIINFPNLMTWQKKTIAPTHSFQLFIFCQMVHSDYDCSHEITIANTMLCYSNNKHNITNNGKSEIKKNADLLLLWFSPSEYVFQNSRPGQSDLQVFTSQ